MHNAIAVNIIPNILILYNSHAVKPFQTSKQLHLSIKNHCIRSYYSIYCVKCMTLHIQNIAILVAFRKHYIYVYKFVSFSRSGQVRFGIQRNASGIPVYYNGTAVDSDEIYFDTSSGSGDCYVGHE